MPIDVMPGGFNPMSLPPRRWGGDMGNVSSHGPGSGAPPTAPGMRMVNSSGGNRPGNLPFGQVDSSGPGRGNLPFNIGPGFGGGRFSGNTGIAGPMSSMGMGGMGGMMGGMFGGMGGGMNNMVQGPSFMRQPQQQQRPRMGGAGGVVDPNFRRMMDFKASGGMGNPMAQKYNAQYGPGAFGVSPSLYYQHLDQQGMPVQRQQPQQNQGMGDPMQFFQQMMPFWAMYSQMLGNRGQQGY